MKNYVESKKKLFEGLSRNAFAVLNKDDKFYSDFKSSVSANIMTYGLGNNSDFQAKEIRQNYSGSKFKILYPEGIINIDTKHIGTHNIYNILASTAAVYCASGKLIHEKVSLAFKDGINVPGRLQEVPYKGKFKIFVDYAHTPDALSKILENLKSFSSSRILLVFGCGGNRDKGKRPVMGKIAAKFCDYFIITNDNPRSENPGKIADDIASGIPKNFKNYSIILNRAEAINKILQTANENDVVIIAGKGHEKKQIIKNKKIPFDDYLTAKSILKK
jgi:UDP-N-acetylmuramoyl-L-alanyl-D-glutamate--2,6-diaminopimelate ligase